MKSRRVPPTADRPLCDVQVEVFQVVHFGEMGFHKQGAAVSAADAASGHDAGGTMAMSDHDVVSGGYELLLNSGDPTFADQAPCPPPPSPHTHTHTSPPAGRPSRARLTTGRRKPTLTAIAAPHHIEYSAASVCLSASGVLPQRLVLGSVLSRGTPTAGHIRQRPPLGSHAAAALGFGPAVLAPPSKQSQEPNASAVAGARGGRDQPGPYLLADAAHARSRAADVVPGQR